MVHLRVLDMEQRTRSRSNAAQPASRSTSAGRRSSGPQQQAAQAAEAGRARMQASLNGVSSSSTSGAASSSMDAEHTEAPPGSSTAPRSQPIEGVHGCNNGGRRHEALDKLARERGAGLTHRGCAVPARRALNAGLHALWRFSSQAPRQRPPQQSLRPTGTPRRARRRLPAQRARRSPLWRSGRAARSTLQLSRLNSQQASIRLGVVKAIESHLLELLIWEVLVT